jgi:hypothetical protein
MSREAPATRRERQVFWAPWQGAGLEHLRLELAEDEVVARGTVLGLAEGMPFRLRYKIKCDGHWRPRKIELSLADIHGERDRRLRADGAGNWRDEDGESLSELAGCLDVDISATPFTNTVALRRLDLQPGETAAVTVVYVKVPELTVRPVSQRYSCSWRALTGALVTYEGLFRGFKADLALDPDGLVLDYPETFRRVAPR